MRRTLSVGLLLATLTTGAWGTAYARQAGSAQPAPRPVRILFIGNSYTYFNNLPRLVEAVAESQKTGPRVEVDAVVSGGKTLQWHWDNGAALRKIRAGGWNFVVLQEQSTLGVAPARSGAPTGIPVINDPAAYFDYGTKFIDEIKKAGATPVLYATWARDGYPEQQRRLDDAFARLADKTDAVLVPAGLAWTVARLESPVLRLYMPDRSHPSATGSYLNALVFYQCLTGLGAPEPPATVTGSELPELGTSPATRPPITLVSLTWGESRLLSALASRVVAQEPHCRAQ
jgi:hypothetical protein